MTDLINLCLNRIDDDVEIAEEYLVGCVTYLKRKNDGRCDRDRVREDFAFMRGIEKYHRELSTISNLSDEALSSLIASTIDLSKDLRHICALFDKIKIASMPKDEAKRQSDKAKQASKLLDKVAKILEPKNDVKIGNLFDEVECMQNIEGQ